MITSQSAISRVHRDLTLGVVVKSMLVTVAVASLFGPVIGWNIDATVVLMVVGVIWMVLSVRSVRSSRMAAASPPLIAAGRFDAAEEQIDGALRSFSISRNIKLLGLHHLAVLRHAQKRWQDAAMLCEALLGERRRRNMNGGLMRSARLMLAEAKLELNDLPGAYQAIQRLHEPAASGTLDLAETMHLMLVQLDYESRIGAWQSMTTGIARKVELAELMSPEGAARTQGLLSLAWKRTGNMEWSDWLRRRATLLKNPEEIVRDRPLLVEVWQ